MKWTRIEDEILCNNTDMLLCDSRGNIHIGWLDDHDNKFYDHYDNEITCISHFIYLQDIERPSNACITNDECLKYLLK